MLVWSRSEVTRVTCGGTRPPWLPSPEPEPSSGANSTSSAHPRSCTVGTTWDTIANFHPGDSATLWGFVPGQSAMAWGANEGAAGHTGATIHAAFADIGTAINGSLTFAGLSLADAQSKLNPLPGTAGGRSYLYVHYNG